MFGNSLSNVTADLLGKLEKLAVDTTTIANSTSYLKKLKVSYDEQFRKLEGMEATVEELMSRLDVISERPIKTKGKGKGKKKKKKK